MNELYNYIKSIINVRERPGIEKTPLIINAYGGPGSGKSTTCLHLVAELKKRGFNAEYVPEYAKELVYDNNLKLLNGSVESQTLILIEQNNRIERLIGNVDFIVSDSPILLSPVYLKKENEQFKELVNELNSKYVSFSFFVERNSSLFKTEGRIHNLEESLEKDQQIKDMLNDNNIYFGTYNHKTVDKIINNVIRTYMRINEPEQNKNYYYFNRDNNETIKHKHK